MSFPQSVVTWPYQNCYTFKRKISLLSSKCIFKAPLNGLYVLRPLTHDSCILMEYQTGTDHCFRRSRDFSKTNNICKSNFPCCRPNVSSNVLCMVFTIYILWHSLSAFLPNIKLEQWQVTVLKSSRDFGKTISLCKMRFHYYCRSIFSKFLSIVQWL